MSPQPVCDGNVEAWVAVCPVEDIVPDTGVAALINGRQVAVFRVSAAAGEAEELFAIDNFDPASGANVLSRGLIGDLVGELMVASPIYKQHYGLRDGRCFEEPSYSVRCWPVRLVDGQVEVRATP